MVKKEHRNWHGSRGERWGGACRSVEARGRWRTTIMIMTTGVSRVMRRMMGMHQTTEATAPGGSAEGPEYLGASTAGPMISRTVSPVLGVPHVNKSSSTTHQGDDVGRKRRMGRTAFRRSS
jgi:hypothetical protein